MRIDSHQHFWKYDPQKHSWIEDHMSILRKDYLPIDLLPKLKAEGFDGTVAVQADQSEAENDFLLALAKRFDFIKGIVGWVDLKSDDLENRLTHYKQHVLFKGFRHVVQDEPKGFLLDPKFIQGVRRLHDFGFSYDILIFHHQLEETLQFVQLLPEMPLVIDHCAKPDIKNQAFDDWYHLMSQLAKFPHIHLKLSGLVTEADWSTWDAEDILPYIKAGLQLFGTDRVMIGSDWPVCTLAGTYGQVMGLVKNACVDLNSTDLDKVLGQNAARFYNL